MVIDKQQLINIIKNFDKYSTESQLELKVYLDNCIIAREKFIKKNRFKEIKNGILRGDKMYLYLAVDIIFEENCWVWKKLIKSHC